MRNNADRMIERQIAVEFDRLNSIFPDAEEKQAIIQRIAELRAMLPDEPVQMEQQPITPTDLIHLISNAFRRRNR